VVFDFRKKEDRPEMRTPSETIFSWAVDMRRELWSFPMPPFRSNTSETSGAQSGGQN
jgi:hypothetical protein